MGSRFEARPLNRRAASAPADRDRMVAVVIVVIAALAVVVGVLLQARFAPPARTELVPHQGTDGSSSGFVVLDVGGIDELALTASNMMPGDVITDAMVIENQGSSRLRYSLSTSSTNADRKDLRSQLTLTIRTVDVTTPSSSCNDFDGTVIMLPATALFDGSKDAGFGSDEAGHQAGDRELDAAATETLCFRLSLPRTTGNAYQGATTTTTFSFKADAAARPISGAPKTFGLSPG